MKLARIQAFSVAALLVAAAAALPLASAPASAQMAPPRTGESFDFDDTVTAQNTTGMSFLVISGMSMVQGTDVAGAVLNNESEVSVTITNENDTADAVTVVAFTGTMDTMSLLSAGSMFINDSSFGNSSFGNSSIASTDDDDDNSGPGSSGDDDDDIGELDDSGRDSPSDFDDFFTEDFSAGNNSAAFAQSMDPFGLFDNMKNGSSVVEQGWESPQVVNVTLVGNATGAMSAAESDMTFVFVMIVPYTEDTPQVQG